MKKEEIDYEALIAAVETEMPNVEHFLDLQSGQVLTIVVESKEALDGAADDTDDGVVVDNRRLAARVRDEPEHYERVPSIAPEAGFRWMQEFASSVADESLRAALLKALRDCTDDCFQSFRRHLAHAPEQEQERWFAFRNEKMEEFIDAWLEGS